MLNWLFIYYDHWFLKKLYDDCRCNSSACCGQVVSPSWNCSREGSCPKLQIILKLFLAPHFHKFLLFYEWNCYISTLNRRVHCGCYWNICFMKFFDQCTLLLKCALIIWSLFMVDIFVVNFRLQKVVIFLMASNSGYSLSSSV